MEIIMSTDLQNELPQIIQFNYKELKEELSQKLEKYNDLVVIEDDIKQAKSDRADLNKLKEAIDRKRIEVKKDCLAPYEAFEKHMKELAALIEQPIPSIDRQLKAFEQVKKDEKRAEIEQIYQDEIGDLKELIPLNKLWNERWLNATYKMADIAADIESTATKVAEGLKIIDELDSEFTPQVKDKFFETLDIAKAISENARLKALREKQEKYNSSQPKQEAPTQANREPAVSPKANSEKDSHSQEVQEEALRTIDFRVWVTKEQTQALKQFLIENKIKYGRVPACQTTA